MKYILLFFSIIIFCIQLNAQPQAINYQGVARNAQGLPIINQSIALRLSILESSATGQAVYIETHNTTTSASGLFNLIIGLGSVESGTFVSIPWGQGDKWLKVEMDTSGGNNFQLIGTTQFLSVPYAIYADNGNWIKSGDAILNSNLGNVGIGTASPDSTAQLDISSTTKGLLPPRMTFSQRNSIINPAAGLIIWCIDCYPSGELQVFNGTIWTNLIGGVALALLPSLTTLTVNNITNSSAECGGNISSDGGAPIITRGVCWDTVPNPTVILQSKTSDGTGTGNFTSYLNGLLHGKTYYVRSYATNASGTSYGQMLSFTTQPRFIGEFYQGGIVVYILQAGDPGFDSNLQHGLIAAPFNQNPFNIFFEWGCFSTIITGADGIDLGSGYQNTTDIVNGCTSSGIAARLCYDLVLNGYDDWFLPSKDELNKLYLNKSIICSSGCDDTWSSTEFNGNSAWHQDLISGSQSANDKNGARNVRAVRYF